jgi:glycosyltransferase involved in cell wall biosynthesis
MARQKAPEVFISTIRRLVRSGRTMRVIMHGEGELASAMDELIAASGLTSVIERRDSSVPVDRTMSDAHLLVVSSHNEGLTLTTLEAIAHGVPVVSTDVGAQSDIVPPRALAPRTAPRAVRALSRMVDELSTDENARHALWQEERKAEKALVSRMSANEWFQREVAAW